MSQRNDMAEKKRILIDGVEIPGLVSISAITLEKGIINVPEFSKIRKIQNGISTQPEIELVYKISKDSETLDFIKDWYFKDQTKDITVIRTDASGTEFARDLLPSCECTKYIEPEFNGESPTYAKITITIVPFDYIPIAAAN
jgi:hypothetical protein